MKTATHIRAGAVPPGSYQNSCYDIEFFEESRSLDATCLKMNGTWEPDAVIVPPGYQGDIANCNGTLVLGSC